LRAVIQRSLFPATVMVNGEITGKIDKGLIVYLGIENEDTEQDIDWLCRKLVNLRIFNDEECKMNLSLKDIGGSILMISQFTLFASTKKGNRPSYLRSARPDFANTYYEKTIHCLVEQQGVHVEKGVFGADMKVEYINDGPVTIVIDTKAKE